MAKERSELSWNTVDVDTLNPDTLALYLASKEAYKAYKVAKDAFEQAMQADFAEHLPVGSELKFGYMFGKLSVAVGAAQERKVKAKASGTLADWLAQQGGRAV
jgi:hypothetical protein